MRIVELKEKLEDVEASHSTLSDSAESSYRQILRSTSIIGGASILNVVIGLLRTKVAAVVLGPAGLGLISLFQSLMATAATAAALGFGTTGTRQIAEASGRDDSKAIAAARRGLFWGTLVLAVAGALIVWALRGVLARAVLDDARLAGDVGWLALGVGLTVAAGSQGALLTGLRRIGDIARVSVLSALLSTALGVGALLVWGDQALLIFVLTAPLASFILGHVFVARLPRTPTPATPLPQLMGQWRTMAQLGVAFMVVGLGRTGAQLVVRTLVQRDLGADALGYFQAAWIISMTYIGFVLTAMGKDYYPRLTAAMHNPAAANRMINEQTEVALLLAAPVLLTILGLAPWIIDVLYSSRFAEATTVLRWQILGDVLKVGSWPLGFAIAASGEGRNLIFAESLSLGAFIGLTWIGLPVLGLEATGIAFLGMYIVLLPVVYGLARRRTKFRWDPVVLRHLVLLVVASSAVSALGSWSDWAGAVAGVVVAIGFGIRSLIRLGDMVDLPSPIRRLAKFGRGLHN